MPTYVITLQVVKTGETRVEVEAKDVETAKEIATMNTDGEPVPCETFQSLYPIEWREISEEERLRKLGMPMLL